MFILKMKELPAPIAAIMPPEAVTKVNAILGNSALSDEQKGEQCDAVFVNLSPEVLEKLPEPPELSGIPADVKKKLKGIHMQKGKNFADKRAEAKAYVDTLPADQQAIFKAAAEKRMA